MKVLFLGDVTFAFLLPTGHMSSAQWIYCFLKNKSVKGMVRSSENLMTPCLKVIQTKMDLFFPSCSSWRRTASVGCGKGRDSELPAAPGRSESNGCLSGPKMLKSANDEPKRLDLAIAQVSKLPAKLVSLCC